MRKRATDPIDVGEWPLRFREIVRPFNHICPTPTGCKARAKREGSGFPVACSACGWSWRKSRKAIMPYDDQPSDWIDADEN